MGYDADFYLALCVMRVDEPADYCLSAITLVIFFLITFIHLSNIFLGSCWALLGMGKPLEQGTYCDDTFFTSFYISSLFCFSNDDMHMLCIFLVQHIMYAPTFLFIF